MKTSISIPDDLFDEADQLARRMDVSRSELYQRAVRAFVVAHDEKAATETLDWTHDERESGKLERVVERLRDVWLDVEIW